MAVPVHLDAQIMLARHFRSEGADGAGSAYIAAGPAAKAGGFVVGRCSAHPVFLFLRPWLGVSCHAISLPRATPNPCKDLLASNRSTAFPGMQRQGKSAFLSQGFQFVDHAGYDVQSLVPEGRVAGVKSERGQQILMLHTAAGAQQIEVFFLETGGLLLILRIKRVHQTVA